MRLEDKGSSANSKQSDQLFICYYDWIRLTQAS